MTHSNLDTIDRFFELYGLGDLEALEEVMDRNVSWYFPGHHPLAGTKSGIPEVVNFFDEMGAVMARSEIKVEKLATGVSDEYVVESQHMITNREDGNNLDHYWSVLWTFKDGKIVEGRHLASDQHAADTFFCKVLMNVEQV